jgi:hypothetical protein
MFYDTADSRHGLSWRRVLCGIGLLAGLLLGQPASANPVRVGTSNDATFVADTHAQVFATTAPIFGSDTATASPIDVAA